MASYYEDIHLMEEEERGKEEEEVIEKLNGLEREQSNPSSSPSKKESKNGFNKYLKKNNKANKQLNQPHNSNVNQWLQHVNIEDDQLPLRASPILPLKTAPNTKPEARRRGSHHKKSLTTTDLPPLDVLEETYNQARSANNTSGTRDDDDDYPGLGPSTPKLVMDPESDSPVITGQRMKKRRKSKQQKYAAKRMEQVQQEELEFSRVITPRKKGLTRAGSSVVMLNLLRQVSGTPSISSNTNKKNTNNTPSRRDRVHASPEQVIMGHECTMNAWAQGRINTRNRTHGGGLSRSTSFRRRAAPRLTANYQSYSGFYSNNSTNNSDHSSSASHHRGGSHGSGRNSGGSSNNSRGGSSTINGGNARSNSQYQSLTEQFHEVLLHVEEERHVGGRLKIGTLNIRADPTGLYFDKQHEKTSTNPEGETTRNSFDSEQGNTSLLDAGEARIHGLDLSFNLGSKGSEGSSEENEDFAKRREEAEKRMNADGKNDNTSDNIHFNPQRFIVLRTDRVAFLLRHIQPNNTFTSVSTKNNTKRNKSTGRTTSCVEPCLMLQGLMINIVSGTCGGIREIPRLSILGDLSSLRCDVSAPPHPPTSPPRTNHLNSSFYLILFNTFMKGTTLHVKFLSISKYSKFMGKSLFASFCST
jgi:hypothetical protein